MSQNKYIRIPIKGMHCRSCEILIEDNLKEIARVKSVDLDYKTGQALIHYKDSAPDLNLIRQAIVEAGYEVGESDGLPILSRDKREYLNLGVAFLFLLALFLVLKGLGLTNINLAPSIGSPSFGLIIVVGLVAGFSTCMALVGGLVLGLATKFAESHPAATSAERFTPHIFFVIGRVLGYAFLGGLLGALGTVFQFSPLTNGLLTLLVGLVMLVMGLQLINIFPRLSKFKLSLPKGISQALGANKKHEVYSHEKAMLMGALTFFLPCGFTQAMQLYAISTGNFAYGALVMGLFALGTAPGLLSIGGLTSLVRGSFKARFFKAAGLALIFFAWFNFNNGYTLASLGLSSLANSAASSTKSESVSVSDPNVTLENGVQVVRMTETGQGYSPNSFSIKKGIPVKWVIDAQAPYSCASVVLVPKLKIQKFLAAGENIVEFTPTESGQLPFSCSMGMYTGVFNVSDNDASSGANSSASADSNLAAAVISPAQAASNGGTCGSGGGGCGCGGGRKQPVNTNSNPVVATISPADSNQESVQVIKTTYTNAKYLDPSVFKVKAGTKVRLEIDVRDSGVGCGYAIVIPGLVDSPQTLSAGAPITMEFTPTTPGSYNITCSMGMIHYGSVIVE